jgi:hypothetical protein
MDATTLARIMEKLPALIQSTEAVITEGGKGPEKLNAVLQALLALVPPEMMDEFMHKTWPKVQAHVTVLVEFYKFVGYFKSRKATK